MEWIIVWLLCAVIGAVISGNKGRGAGGGFFLGLLFGPLGILLAAVLPAVNTQPPSEARQLAGGTVKKCPFCAELIRLEATVCKHCGRDVPGAVSPHDQLVSRAVAFFERHRGSNHPEWLTRDLRKEGYTEDAIRAALSEAWNNPVLPAKSARSS